ncbi:SRPBCC domain-containing protein [Sneathiella sp. P13V-1]|uniref:SRPBCC family protein n=1 Tax=Sneathiella sp. P13V-1 TaxID=2697366 RepID=UPI00187B1B60|nr:SRPBCC domain-containing protein [Sneathiella sp. P13V-1]MBE7638302.1 SRPBCC domain-containing protein [Sneathiella sp. P13V-1]
MTETKIVKTVFFKAPANTVWSFLTDKEKLGKWYHPAEEDLEAGQEYTLLEQNDDGSYRKIVWGKVLEMNAPYHMVQTFCINPFQGKETTVTWQLEETFGGTVLTLTHEGVAEAAGEGALGIFCALDMGWDSHFGRLRNNVNH